MLKKISQKFEEFLEHKHEVFVSSDFLNSEIENIRNVIKILRILIQRKTVKISDFDAAKIRNFRRLRFSHAMHFLSHKNP